MIVELLRVKACRQHVADDRFTQAVHHPACPGCNRLLVEEANRCGHNRAEMEAIVREVSRKVEEQLAQKR